MNWTIEPLPAYGPLFEGAIAVYGEAFIQPPYCDPDRGKDVRKRIREIHAHRDEYRAFAAVREDATIAGMIYGYHGRKGQWWHETVRRQLPHSLYSHWLGDCYELVEVAVAPRFQGLGIGRALIEHLLCKRKERTCVLSTRTDSRAHELYRRLGFEELAQMPFVENGATFYVMGKILR
ncbi:MAG: GNAT family N-acetyltransferase [Chloroflexi bacterium]|nr:GNAT family N-acetyltransferase [Chloroflexota bacterium]